MISSMGGVSGSVENRAGWPTFAYRVPRSNEHSRAAASHAGARRTFNDFVFAGLLLGLAWVPFWFGSNRSLAWGFNAAYFCGLVVVYEMRLLWAAQPHTVAIRRVWPAAVGVGVVCIWSLLQMATRVPPFFEHPVWQLTRDVLELNVPSSVSVNREATEVAMLRLITSTSVFWLTLQLCRSPYRARRLIQAVVLTGLAYATYGIVAFFMFPETILWFDKTSYLHSLTATFVNRNSYSTYAAIGLICAVVLVVNETVRGPGLSSNPARRLANLVAALAGSAGGWLAAALVIGLALMFTGSRGGGIAALAGLSAAMILGFLQKRGARGSAVTAGLIAITLLGGVAFGFGDLLAGRFGAYGLQGDDRLAVYATTLRSIADRPLLGFGYGTFEQVFPIYRDTTTTPFGTWDKAHNTVLEVVQGLGIPVAVFLLAGIGYLAWRCLAGAFNGKHFAPAAVAASAVTTAVLAHSFVDFSLQIQAVTLTWIAVVGAGVAQSWPDTVDTRS